MELLSIVVPCFNEEATIPIFYDTVEKIKGKIDAEVEYCFVDDGSKDNTLAILRDLNKKSGGVDRKSTRLNSSHKVQSRMPSSA